MAARLPALASGAAPLWQSFWGAWFHSAGLWGSDHSCRAVKTRRPTMARSCPYLYKMASCFFSTKATQKPGESLCWQPNSVQNRPRPSFIWEPRNFTWGICRLPKNRSAERWN